MKSTKLKLINSTFARRNYLNRSGRLVPKLLCLRWLHLGLGFDYHLTFIPSLEKVLPCWAPSSRQGWVSLCKYSIINKLQKLPSSVEEEITVLIAQKYLIILINAALSTLITIPPGENEIWLIQWWRFVSLNKRTLSSKETGEHIRCKWTNSSGFRSYPDLDFRTMEALFPVEAKIPTEKIKGISKRIDERESRKMAYCSVWVVSPYWLYQRSMGITQWKLS